MLLPAGCLLWCLLVTDKFGTSGCGYTFDFFDKFFNFIDKTLPVKCRQPYQRQPVFPYTEHGYYFSCFFILVHNIIAVAAEMALPRFTTEQHYAICPEIERIKY